MRVEVDISDVMKMLNGIQVNVVKVAVPKAINLTATQIQRKMKLDASAYTEVTSKTKGRWSWQTFGRIPRAITISKLFKNGKDFNAKNGDRGRKVFIQTRRGAAESQRAPHWNLVVYGHKQWIPTGVPGKGQARRSKLNPVKPPHPMFVTTAAQSGALLMNNLQNQLKLALRNAGKK